LGGTGSTYEVTIDCEYLVNNPVGTRLDGTPDIGEEKIKIMPLNELEFVSAV
jgi:hypothetical protein